MRWVHVKRRRADLNPVRHGSRTRVKWSVKQNGRRGRMAAFLVLDRRNRITPATTTWLDAVVACGGTTCVTASVVVTPVWARPARR
jgi:hypothetical protein